MMQLTLGNFKDLANEPRRKTPITRPLAPLPKLDNELTFYEKCNEAISHGTDFSSAIGKFNNLGTFSERNVKRNENKVSLLSETIEILSDPVSCYAIFADCGLGKTLDELEWARQVSEQGIVLIVAPLCVAQQTIVMGKQFGYEVNLCKGPEDRRGL